MASLYTILFSNGLVKVGMTKGNPKSRLATHASSIGVTNVTVADYEFLECHDDDVAGAERSLINQCKAIDGAIQKSKEWFYGIGFDDAVRIMRGCVDSRAKKYNEDQNSQSAINLEKLSGYFTEEAKDVLVLAAKMSRMDDELAEAIMSAIGSGRREILDKCWSMMVEYEDSNLSGEECYKLMVDRVSKLLCFNFVFKVGS